MKQAIFDIRKSDKSCLDAPEKYVVVYQEQVLLRILGEELSYEIMTATVGEDFGVVKAFENPQHLIDTAMTLTHDFEVELAPQICRDYDGREYVKICVAHYLSDVYRVANALIEKLEA
ncbi:hypothetical protein KY858_004324 [Vibrio vulnificus]|uniref:hypothetical protein n=1 Tax=Vibrio TaxID=662 RepID=UPI000446FED9|nr:MULTISPECIES: hypothetical protein [Vibrio]EWS66810.1 hypothetical protein Y702_24710 [Vibrio vulnificus BAA87]EGQ7941068.1 hypothetical protein [Vibrio vulnificus]EGQ7967117.1 hypothetical protein [Vibrio vulnificus]EGQ8002339.1 hypothetical protein [Vibrio vulnificus]EGQ8075438.1 hypothetical protein [Vibrio vulnificus]